MKVTPASAPNTITAETEVIKKCLVLMSGDQKSERTTTPAPATATGTQAQTGKSAASATREAATTVAVTMNSRAQCVETRDGSRRETQIAAAPTPTAAKKPTPKYQYGSSLPFHSFQRSPPKMSGSSSGRAVGRGK